MAGTGPRPATALTAMTRAAGGLLLRDVELLGGRRTDVRVRPRHGRSTGRAEPAARRADVLDGDGGALSVGLADHHLHLLAMAAAAESLDLRPAAVPDRPAVEAALAGAAPDGTGWIRAVGYAEQGGRAQPR